MILLLQNFILVFALFVDGASVMQECIRSDGVDYRGEQQITSSGNKCLNWVEATRDYNVTADLDGESGLGDHSFCRNPDSSERPWCYVIGLEGKVQRQDCVIDICRDEASPTPVPDAFPSSSPGQPQAFQADQAPSVQSENAAVRPVPGASRRVYVEPKRKKDLGIMGYVLGIVMMAVIILLGVGISLGYLYKRGQDLRRQQERRVYEQEMKRISLPLSAFSNPACQLLDEGSPSPQTPADEGGAAAAAGGSDALMGQAGTPGA